MTGMWEALAESTMRACTACECDARGARIAELEKDKVRLDWFGAPHGCEPILAERYDGARMWRYRGIWYDNMRSAIDAAMADRRS